MSQRFQNLKWVLCQNTIQWNITFSDDIVLLFHKHRIIHWGDLFNRLTSISSLSVDFGNRKRFSLYMLLFNYGTSRCSTNMTMAVRVRINVWDRRRRMRPVQLESPGLPNWHHNYTMGANYTVYNSYSYPNCSSLSSPNSMWSHY